MCRTTAERTRFDDNAPPPDLRLTSAERSCPDGLVLTMTTSVESRSDVGREDSTSELQNLNATPFQARDGAVERESGRPDGRVGMGRVELGRVRSKFRKDRLIGSGPVFANIIYFGGNLTNYGESARFGSRHFFINDGSRRVMICGSDQVMKNGPVHNSATEYRTSDSY